VGKKQAVKKISVYDLGKVKRGVLTFKDGCPISELSSYRKNAQGKTNFLMGLDFTSQGKRGLKKKPVHDGAKKARVEVELTDLVIVSEITFNGTVSRRVIPKKGSGIVGNEEFIGKIFKGVDLDPEEFKGKSRIEKFRFAMKLTGCQDKLDAVDAKRAIVYDQRALAKSRHKDSQAQLDGMIYPNADLPKEEIPASELVAELNKVRGLELKKSTCLSKVERLKSELAHDLVTKKNTAQTNINLIIGIGQGLKQDVVDTKNDIARLEKELATAKGDLEVEEKMISDKQDELVIARKEFDAINISDIDFTADPNIKTAQDEHDGIVVPDASELEAKIESNEVTNAKIRSAKSYWKKKSENDKNRSEVEAKEKEYQDLADKKIEIVKAGAIQIPGLDLDFQSETLMYKGRDIDSASYAESIMSATEMLIEANPDCPFFVIRNAASIGDEIRQQMVDMCLAKGAQGIFESISEGDLPGLIFVDGVGEVYEGQNELFKGDSE
jgi:hypothetical protein